ncbi:MAG: ATP-binding protein [Deltaproteobacteria bacterium]|nr:ATP-binding protein [Deltaproteobacteria bacterium]
MVYSIHSCALLGLDPHAVLCEVDLACQLPAFSLVGLPSSLTQESRERIRAAVVNSGFEWPARKVTINLLPANLPKWGSHYELAMALGILGASSERVAPLNVLALGELSLSGAVRPCGWLPAIADWLTKTARLVREKSGEPLLLIAHESDVRTLCMAVPELSALAELCGASSLTEAFCQLSEASGRMLPQSVKQVRFFDTPVSAYAPPRALDTLAQVQGEPLGTIAALVAIAGQHHCLFAGPHGMGKSMLIRAICEGSLPLSASADAERAAVLRTFGDSFLNRTDSGPLCRRPVVNLQTSISRAALEGALLTSGQVLPGELTRAHLGVLVADELLEYHRDVLEAFRQPLDEGFVRLQRAKFRTVLPARFQLLASTNLCPCGHTPHKHCRCGQTRRKSYQARLSGPVSDRFDVIVVVGSRNLEVPLIKIPADLRSLVSELSDPKDWEPRLRNISGAAASDVDPSELWSQVSCGATDRGRLKLARVAKTVAALLGQPRSARHLRLAQLLRQDIENALQPGISEPIGNFRENNGSGYNALHNI